MSASTPEPVGGQVAWPKHMKRRRKAPKGRSMDATGLSMDAIPPAAALDAMPVISFEGGFLFLTCKENDRLSISTSVERLINMLDDLDGDPDLEPSLGGISVDLGSSSRDDREDDTADNEPSLGWSVDGEHGTEFPAVFGTDLEGDDSDYEPEETDQNGDEGDYGQCEDDALGSQLYCLPLSTPWGGQGL